MLSCGGAARSVVTELFPVVAIVAYEVMILRKASYVTTCSRGMVGEVVFDGVNDCVLYEGLFFDECGVGMVERDSVIVGVYIVMVGIDAILIASVDAIEIASGAILIAQ